MIGSRPHVGIAPSPKHSIPYHPAPGKLSDEEFTRMATRANNLLDQANELIMEARQLHVNIENSQR